MIPSSKVILKATDHIINFLEWKKIPIAYHGHPTKTWFMDGIILNFFRKWEQQKRERINLRQWGDRKSYMSVRELGKGFKEFQAQSKKHVRFSSLGNWFKYLNQNSTYCRLNGKGIKRQGFSYASTSNFNTNKIPYTVANTISLLQSRSLAVNIICQYIFSRTFTNKKNGC